MSEKLFDRMARSNRIEELIADNRREISDSELLKNVTETPIGRVLGMMAQLPEIRYEKVARIRERINSGSYEVDDSIDCVVDRMIEEMIA